MFRKLCGDPALRSVVLVTNMWDEVSPDVGEAREYELYNNFSKLAMLKGMRMFQHHNTIASAHDIVRMIIPNAPVVLQIQWELVIEKKDILNTAAGDAINKDLNDQAGRHRDELKRVREEMMQALKEKDEQTRKELEEERRRMREWMESIKNDSAGLEARMKEMEQRAKEERERAEAKHRRQLADLSRHLQVAALADGYRGSSRQHDSKSDILLSC